MAICTSKGKKKKIYIVRLVRAYRKAPTALRVQVGLFLFVVAAVIAGIFFGIWALISGGSDDEQTREKKMLAEQIKVVEEDGQKKVIVPKYTAKVTDRVLSYRGLVEKYGEKYKIKKYKELVLAMIQQESDGQEPDVMQAEESGYNHYPPIGGADESIFCGMQELRDCLRLARVRGPADIERIKLAIQGYNYGQGYIRMRLKEGEGYSEESAYDFSEMMKRRLGMSVYGDPKYVEHVLRYYQKSDEETESVHSRE